MAAFLCLWDSVFARVSCTCVCVCVSANGGWGMQSSWTKVRWPISHPADACTGDPRRQVGDTNWQRAPPQSRVNPWWVRDWKWESRMRWKEKGNQWGVYTGIIFAVTNHWNSHGSQSWMFNECVARIRSAAGADISTFIISFLTFF